MLIQNKSKHQQYSTTCILQIHESLLFIQKSTLNMILTSYKLLNERFLLCVIMCSRMMSNLVDVCKRLLRIFPRYFVFPLVFLLVFKSIKTWYEFFHVIRVFEWACYHWSCWSLDSTWWWKLQETLYNFVTGKNFLEQKHQLVVNSIFGKIETLDVIRVFAGLNRHFFWVRLAE